MLEHRLDVVQSDFPARTSAIECVSELRARKATADSSFIRLMTVPVMFFKGAMMRYCRSILESSVEIDKYPCRWLSERKYDLSKLNIKIIRD
jgi:hypothetical protein